MALFEFWILLTACLAAATCALTGSFLVLRKQAMLGDAISHAILPGIAIAFLLTASRNTFPMLIGAGAFGLLTVYATEKLQEKGRLKSDSSMGVIFTTLFAIGVIIVTAFASQVDLDQECILYGEIAYVPWDIWFFNGINMGPRPVWILGFVCAINLAFVVSCYKELKIYAFDRQLAVSLGLPVIFIHYGLMSSVLFSTIASFESVGAILVVALIVVPPATAYMLTQKLSLMLAGSVIIGVVSAISGYYLAVATNSSIAGAIAVMTGIFFFLAVFLSPSEGVLIRKWRARAGEKEPDETPESLKTGSLSV